MSFYKTNVRTFWAGLRTALLLSVALLFSVSQIQPTFAQAPQLTTEQMQRLQQLPPALREEALAAYRELQRQNAPVQMTAEDSDESTEDSGQSVEEAESEEERVVEQNSKLIIDLLPSPFATPEDLDEVNNDPVVSELLGSRYYELDGLGVLHMPGLQDILLLGLTAEEAKLRLGAVESFQGLAVNVNILGTLPVGIDALEPFGYKIFDMSQVPAQRSRDVDASNTSGFEPDSAVPVPPDYILGPGDSIRVQLYGNATGIYEFEVSRDGVLNLPQLGPITVAGLPFSEFRADLNRRVNEMLIGTQVSVTMGELRSIRVFILGDARRPGSYVVSSLATVSSALYRSGGISHIGSLRNIQVKREGSLVATLDLYDLLLNGDTSGDIRVQPGDVIFVPPIGSTVGVAGAVRRPAIYEMKGPAAIADVINYAGGMLPEADSAEVHIDRINSRNIRQALNVNLSAPGGNDFRVASGDVITIRRILPELASSVVLSGHVQRPGAYQWRAGMRITDLIASAQALKPGADVNYVIVRRENYADRSVRVLSVDLSDALTTQNSGSNIELQERDSVFVFSLAFGRQRIIGPILEELRLQSRFGNSYRQVSIDGRVRAPGAYPLEDGMRVSDLIRAGADMAEGAYPMEAQLTRSSIGAGGQRERSVIKVDLQGILNGREETDLVLEPHDQLMISMAPDWDLDWAVVVEGEVRFPGTYYVLHGETLSQLVARAGGLTKEAFPGGTIFLRESLAEKEREQIDVLARRMESDLASLSLESVDTAGAEAMTIGQSLLSQLRTTEPVGRLVIDIDRMVAARESGEGEGDINLRDGDHLMIPRRPQEVTVLGETQYATSHVFQPGLTRDDYIAMSGGLTRRADKKLIYVVRASGAVISSGGSRWFGRSNFGDIQPGDTIVVPLETGKIRPLTFWAGVTQILYQSAIALAAVKTFSN